VPHKRSASKIVHTISNLARWWGDKRLSDVTARTCRAYAADRPQVAARRDLETLRAAIRYWHREYGPLPSIPFVVLPDKPAARERWLTREEAARLLWAARDVEHLRRFVLLGLYTGSRAGAILGARWDWIDLDTGLMRRRAPGAIESTKRTPPIRLAAGILAHVRRWWRIDAMSVGNEPELIRPLFICHYNGGRVIKLRRSWQAAVGRAGLDGKVTPHTLRHTRATWLMRDGVNIWDAAQQLGMSALVLEKTYGHFSPGYQKRDQ
jgi:integrase